MLLGPTKRDFLRPRSDLSDQEAARLNLLVGERKELDGRFEEFDDATALEIIQLLYGVDEARATAHLASLRAPETSSVFALTD